MPKEAIGVLLVLLVGTSYAMPNSLHKAKEIRDAKAAEMLRYMNFSIDPCQDFYEYSCANYGKYFPYNEVHQQRGPLAEAVYDMEAQTLKSMQTDEPSDNYYDRQVKNYFRSCVNTRSSPTGPAQLRELMREFGEMPALAGERWREQQFDWVQVLGRMLHHIAGTEMMLSVVTMPDFANVSQTALSIAHSDLSFPGKFHYFDAGSKDVYRKALIKQMVANLQLIGIQEDLAQRTAEEMFEFELALAHGLLEENFAGQILDVVKLMDVEELRAKYLDVGDLKELLLLSSHTSPRQVYVEIGYVQNAMEAVRRTPKRVVANYLFYNYYKQFAYNVNQKKEEFRQTICMDLTRKNFNKNLDNMFYRKNFEAGDRRFIATMWDELKSSFEDMIRSPSLEWISAETRSKIIEKLHSIKLEINTYEELDFAKDFEQMHLTLHDYVANMQAILAARGRLAWTPGYVQPMQESRPMGAHYMPITNTITVALNFVKPSGFWSPHLPRAFNFGQLMSVLSHELVHAFDDLGRMYDLHGSNVNWWDARSSDEFNKRKTCFIGQYAKYTHLGSPLGRIEDQGENIADNGGIHLAYHTFHRQQLPSGREENFLPGHNITAEQLFFISYAQAWCESVHPDLAKTMLSTDAHMPNPVRVLGPLANMQEFAQAFQCPAGSTMHPIVKCRIY